MPAPFQATLLCLLTKWRSLLLSRRLGDSCPWAFDSHVPRTESRAFLILNRQCRHWDGRPGSCYAGDRCALRDSHKRGVPTEAKRYTWRMRQERNAGRPAAAAKAVEEQAAGHDAGTAEHAAGVDAAERTADSWTLQSGQAGAAPAGAQPVTGQLERGGTDFGSGAAALTAADYLPPPTVMPPAAASGSHPPAAQPPGLQVLEYTGHPSIPPPLARPSNVALPSTPAGATAGGTTTLQQQPQTPASAQPTSLSQVHAAQPAPVQATPAPAGLQHLQSLQNMALLQSLHAFPGLPGLQALQGLQPGLLGLPALGLAQPFGLQLGLGGLGGAPLLGGGASALGAAAGGAGTVFGADNNAAMQLQMQQLQALVQLQNQQLQLLLRGGDPAAGSNPGVPQYPGAGGAPPPPQ